MSFGLDRKTISALIVLPTLLLSASFLAQGTTSFAAVAASLPAPSVTSPARRIDRRPGLELPDHRAILLRNVFDPSTGPLPRVAQVRTADPREPYEPPAESLPACEGGVELVALVFAEGRSEWSMASLATASKTPLLYREGSSVQDMQVVTILREAVYLRQSGGRLCSLALFSTRALTVARTPPPETTALRVDALDQNIRALSDTRFRVRRSFVDQLLQNPSEILAARRIIPHAENGQVVGLKLYGIRRHSLLARLGLQNGDSLRTINGYAMSSLDTALEAYAKLRGANRLSVTVERRGRSVILDYAIE